jgi:transposase
MKINKWQYRKIADCFPIQRGNVCLDNLTVLNAILYVAENGCKWRALPKEFGKWDTIYARMSYWVRKGILDKIFKRLQQERFIRIKIEAVSLDSTAIKVHPDGTGALKKRGRSPLESPEVDGQPSFIWLPRMPKAQ